MPQSVPTLPIYPLSRAVSRVWKPLTKNSSAGYEVDIVALEHPEVPGYLAVKAGGLFSEFRMQHGFDAGLPRPAVLLHQPADPNSLIIASDADNYINEWQPGQVYGAKPPLFVLGGTRIVVHGLDLERKTARLGSR